MEKWLACKFVVGRRGSPFLLPLFNNKTGEAAKLDCLGGFWFFCKYYLVCIPDFCLWRNWLTYSRLKLREITVISPWEEGVQVKQLILVFLHKSNSCLLNNCCLQINSTSLFLRNKKIYKQLKLNFRAILV